MSLRNTTIGKIYYGILKALVISPLARVGISPNVVTFGGVFMAIVATISFYFSPLIGSIFLALSGIADSLDGQLARNSSEEPSSFGSFLDSTVDRISDGLYLIGFLLYSWRHTSEGFFFLSLAILYLIALNLTILFSYTKAKIEALGKGCDVGFMERAKRVIFFLIWGVSLWVFREHSLSLVWVGIVIYTLLVGFSVVQRIKYARDILRY